MGEKGAKQSQMAAQTVRRLVDDLASLSESACLMAGRARVRREVERSQPSCNATPLGSVTTRFATGRRSPETSPRGVGSWPGERRTVA